jgi:serine/threonine-protein kinase
VIPEEVRQLLQEGEEALAAGKPDDALRLAARSEQAKRTAAANWLKARAYCHKKDMGGVNGVRQNMTPAEDRRVKSYCKPYIEL